MKPKDLKVGDKVFLVKEESFLFHSKEIETAEVTKATGSSVYIDDTRFPIKATFPLFHQVKNGIDRRQHLWLTKEDYQAHLAEQRKAKESRVALAMHQVTEGLSILSDDQLDKLAKGLKKAIVSLGTTDEK